MSHALPSVCFIGLGYVGLPTAALLAGKGCRVTGVDISEKVVGAIMAKRAHFEEADLHALVHRAVESGCLTAQMTPAPADIFVIAVPTPIMPDSSPDMSAVLAAAGALADHVRPGNLVILESTSPIGATAQVRDVIAAKRPDLRISRDAADAEDDDVGFAYCPERILPGNTVSELINNDRTIGGMSRRATERARDFYALFCTGTLHRTNAPTAEMAKLVENSYRDVCIAFANELSLICAQNGLDVGEVIGLANAHPRVNILNPGPGVGGHCIPVDPWFLVADYPAQTRLIKTAREVNDGKTDFCIEQIAAANKPEQVTAFFGMSYKPDVDDPRNSPSVSIIAALARRFPGQPFLVVDPYYAELPRALAGLANVTLATRDEALARGGKVVLLTGHKSFHSLQNECRQRRIDWLNVSGAFLERQNDAAATAGGRNAA